MIALVIDRSAMALEAAALARPHAAGSRPVWWRESHTAWPIHSAARTSTAMVSPATWVGLSAPSATKNANIATTPRMRSQKVSLRIDSSAGGDRASPGDRTPASAADQAEIRSRARTPPMSGRARSSTAPAGAARSSASGVGRRMWGPPAPARGGSGAAAGAPRALRRVSAPLAAALAGLLGGRGGGRRAGHLPTPGTRRSWRISFADTSCITPRPNWAAGPVTRMSVTTLTFVPSPVSLHRRRDRRRGGALAAGVLGLGAHDGAGGRPRRPPRSRPCPCSGR